MFLAILWVGLIFCGLARFRRTGRTRSTTIPSKPGNHESSWISLLLEFHKAQCYFTSTLMIASFTYGIYNTDMLVTFMIIPLATNGVLPIVFAHLLLLYNKKVGSGITLLTLLSYLLSSTVYWTLYAHLIGLETPDDERLAYQQFMFKLTAIPACGGYSALGACERILGTVPVKNAANKIRVLTPLVWTGSTIILLGMLGYQLLHWNRKRREAVPSPERAERQEERKDVPVSRTWQIAFWTTTLVMGAGIAIQLSLLAIGRSLNMMDPWNWGFGQIVAVTIWIPPLLEYLFGEISERFTINTLFS
jgi:hypothetical protein